MTQLIADGYIVFDTEGLIHGRGATAIEAWEDALMTFAHAHIDLVEAHEDAPEDAPYLSVENLKTWPATAALLRRIHEHGGNITWGEVNGIACTVEEEEEV